MTYVMTRSGTRFNLTRPHPAAVAPIDIAHALSRIPRFNGHTTAFYSVAQHSLLVQQFASSRVRPYALLHDAHEAYTGDIATGVKSFLRGLTELQDRLDTCIYSAFGLAWPPTPEIAAEIRELDLRAVYTEGLQLMAHFKREDVMQEDRAIEKFAITIFPLHYHEAYEAFLKELLHLSKRG